MALTHPAIDQLNLSTVLSALGDETRLAMVGRLARVDELSAGQFGELASKTVLSYHLAKLREAGLVRVRAQSTRRLVSLRRADLDGRFPGLLDTILPSAIAADPVRLAPLASTRAANHRFDDWIVD